MTPAGLGVQGSCNGTNEDEIEHESGETLFD